MKNLFRIFLAHRMFMVALAGAIALITSQTLQAQEPEVEPEFIEVTDLIAEGGDIEIKWQGEPLTLYKIRIIKPNGQTLSANQYGTGQNGTGLPITLENVQETGAWTFQLWPKDATNEDFLTKSPIDFEQTTVEPAPE